jgi:5-enolpyruvylshikimate-3-phosphate synthase
MKHQITYSGGPLCGTFHIPASKSISNRLLIIYALAGQTFQSSSSRTVMTLQ